MLTRQRWLWCVIVCVLAGCQGAADPPTVRVATWNLEWFNSHSRGFPELQAGAMLPPRTAEGLRTLAYLIADKHQMQVVGLQEIQSQQDLDSLLAYLPEYQGRVLEDSAQQHCALLWHGSVAVTWQEPLRELAVTRGQRQGLHVRIQAGKFDFDYLVVHLANDKPKVRQQLDLIEAWLAGKLPGSQPTDEDVIIGGDFNLTPAETPFRQLFPGGLLKLISLDDALLVPVWRGLTASQLPPTRAPSGKTIDHLLLTPTCHLYERWGEAWVPREDLWFGLSRYRELISDHLPVVQDFRIDFDND